MARRSRLNSFGQRFPFFDTLGSFVSEDDVRNAPKLISQFVESLKGLADEYIRREQLTACNSDERARINKCCQEMHKERALMNKCLCDMMLSLGDDPSYRDKFIAINAFITGMMTYLPFVRLLEDDIVVGAEKKAAPKKMNKVRTQTKFAPTREQLLQWMKEAKRRYPRLNQKELCSKVVDMQKLSVKGSRVRQVMIDMEIRASDYSQK